jgi:hypothetical protein
MKALDGMDIVMLAAIVAITFMLGVIRTSPIT